MKHLLSTLIITTALVSSAAFASDSKQDWNGMKAGGTPTVTSSDSAFGNMYIVGGIGYAFNTKKSSLNFTNPTASVSLKTPKPVSFSLGLGMNIAQDFRVDGVFSFEPSASIKTTPKDNNTESQIVANALNNSGMNKVRTISLMVNSYYDFVEITDDIKAYGTLGLGFSNRKSSGKSKNAFSWQAGLGITGKISDTVNWDLGYRYKDSGKMTSNNAKLVNGSNKLKFASHNIVASIRVGL